jgi:hypothetical protein
MNVPLDWVVGKPERALSQVGLGTMGQALTSLALTGTQAAARGKTGGLAGTMKAAAGIAEEKAAAPVGRDLATTVKAGRIRPSPDDPYQAGAATFEHYDVTGNKTVPIDNLIGGTRSTDKFESARVQQLMGEISGPKGYISRILVDDSGNVIEGQHRLEALKRLGYSEAPVTVITDLARSVNLDRVRSAIGKIHPDQVNGIITEALRAMRASGSAEKALTDYVMPREFQAPFERALRALSKQSQR